MARCYAAGYANPASQHQPGQRARRILEDARQRVAEILGADLNCLKPDRLIFTSGGTEANNLAILGIAQAGRQACEDRRRDAYATGKSSSRRSNMPACWKRPNISWNSAGGSIRCPSIARAWFRSMLLNRCWPSPRPASSCADRVPALSRRRGESARLVSVMLANHETGVLQPIEQLAALCAFGRSAFAHRCGRGGGQGADQLPRAGRDRLEHCRTQVPRPAGHWRT